MEICDDPGGQLPPVRLMGHLLPSRLPDKRGRHTQSKQSTSPEGGSTFLDRRSLRAAFG